MRIDTEAVIDRGGEIFGRSRIVGGIRGEAVARTVNDAAANAAAGEHRRETTRPVITTVAARTRSADNPLADARRATHLARPDDERLVEHPTFLQIVQQCA